jgi:hypothetical protein
MAGIGRLSNGNVMGLTRRRFAVLPFALAGVAWPARRAEAAALPAPVSLAAELDVALRQGKPLVVMASLDGCPFCKVVRDSYLAPLRRETGQPVIQLDIQSARPVLDFKSAHQSHDALLRAWEVNVAPTVLFFGRGGREVAPRLAGASIPDFYGAYLEERLRIARLKTA